MLYTRQRRAEVGLLPTDGGFVPRRDNPVAGLLGTAWAHFDHTSIVGSNPVTEWQDLRGTAARDLDVVVGTGANLITLESGVALLTGTAGDYFSTPDSVAASITGSITVIVYAAAADWTPSGNQTPISKWTVGGARQSYLLTIVTTGGLRVATSVDGSASVLSSSTAATGFSDGTGHWLRVTVDISGNTSNFYTSDQPHTTDLGDISWVQLGNSNITHTEASIFDGSGVVEIGSSNAGASNNFLGKIRRGHIISGTDPTVTPVVNFDGRDASVNTATWPSSATAETWTANGDAFVNATGFQGIYSRGSVGLETTAGQTINSPVTVFAVFKPTLAAPATTQRIYDARSEAGERMILVTLTTSADKYSFFQGAAFRTITPAYDTDLRIITVQFLGTAVSKLTVSDVGSVTGDGGTNNWDFASLFMSKDGTEHLQGLFLEFLVFDRALSAGEISLVQAHLAAKYA